MASIRPTDTYYSFINYLFKASTATAIVTSSIFIPAVASRVGASLAGKVIRPLALISGAVSLASFLFGLFFRKPPRDESRTELSVSQVPASPAASRADVEAASAPPVSVGTIGTSSVAAPETPSDEKNPLLEECMKAFKDNDTEKLKIISEGFKRQSRLIEKEIAEREQTIATQPPSSENFAELIKLKRTRDSIQDVVTLIDHRLQQEGGTQIARPAAAAAANPDPAEAARSCVDSIADLNCRAFVQSVKEALKGEEYGKVIGVLVVLKKKCQSEEKTDPHRIKISLIIQLLAQEFQIQLNTLLDQMDREFSTNMILQNTNPARFFMNAIEGIRYCFRQKSVDTQSSEVRPSNLARIGAALGASGISEKYLDAILNYVKEIIDVKLAVFNMAFELNDLSTQIEKLTNDIDRLDAEIQQAKNRHSKAKKMSEQTDLKNKLSPLKERHAKLSAEYNPINDGVAKIVEELKKVISQINLT